jgi:hypothetical protein
VKIVIFGAARAVPVPGTIVRAGAGWSVRHGRWLPIGCRGQQ